MENDPYFNKRIKNGDSVYEIKYKLGSGSSATVYSACNVKDSKFYAIKVMNIRDRLNKEQMEKQINIHKKFRSENIIKYYLNILDQNNADVMYIVMEQGEQSLANHLETLENRSMSNTELADMLTGVAEGIKEIHKNEVIHRDIKIQNIIMINGVYKITDFGISATGDLRKTFVGTPIYLAPELIQNQQTDEAYSNKVDIWSFGILAFQAYFTCNPFYYTKSSLQSISDYTNFLNNIKRICSPKFKVENVVEGLKKQKRNKEAEFVYKKNLKTPPWLKELFEKIFVYNADKRINIWEVSDILKSSNFGLSISQQIPVPEIVVKKEKENQNLHFKKTNSTEIVQKPFQEIKRPDSLKKVRSNIQKGALPDQLLFLSNTIELLQGHTTNKPSIRKCVLAIELTAYILEKDIYMSPDPMINYTDIEDIKPVYNQNKNNRKEFIRTSTFTTFEQMFTQKIEKKEAILFRILLCSVWLDIIAGDTAKFIRDYSKQIDSITALIDLEKQSQQCTLDQLERLQNYIFDTFYST